MTTVNPLQTLAFVLRRHSSTVPSCFSVSQLCFVSAQSEARHD
ncbi:hypothetical protein GLGCALEP_00868 [Pseudomonas sp. MM221]|nr:hypothetical protein GLGCALEP_00868 [Pseudomonas sp. MM221]